MMRGQFMAKAIKELFTGKACEKWEKYAQSR